MMGEQQDIHGASKQLNVDVVDRDGAVKEGMDDMMDKDKLSETAGGAAQGYPEAEQQKNCEEAEVQAEQVILMMDVETDYHICNRSERATRAMVETYPSVIFVHI